MNEKRRERKGSREKVERKYLQMWLSQQFITAEFNLTVFLKWVMHAQEFYFGWKYMLLKITKLFTRKS